ncbi:Glycosyltransferase family 10 (fucosyltransferase) C-term [Pedobacter westerhofensis]|uniref:Glycosyltransferase family 10 (Fucosyltransferase) C-term n=1 Tax=Pedobacter westerhofensis TaxID=425512 RepID=A0A521FRB4_9SPHI|nr:glycosyltransferase family 10 [Pedobacter westerhofensis]SMO98738.1 Glycosyltransferase family 10 (fucosyltransferase) C-term [Pedobacter westerhofensis]
MKVKFFSDYEVSEKLLDRFKANYDVYDDAIQFTTGEDYDYAVAFNRADGHHKPGTKLITVIQEPTFSEAFEHGDSLTNSDYLLVHDKELFERIWNVKLGKKVIESPAYMFYHDRVDHHFYDGVEHIMKQKKISMIVSAHHFKWGNYLKRINVLNQILKSDLDIDIYGRNWYIQDDRYKGELQYKHVGLLPYEYSIAIENSHEKNYISEKFFDCVLCNTVPIYNGAPNINDVYDNRYFRTIDLDSPTIVEDIKAIIARPSPGCMVNKEIYIKNYNLYTKLKEIIFEVDC